MNKPIMRVCIAGCRDYHNYEEAKEFIDGCLSEFQNKNTVIIVSGGAKGADALGERYVKEHGLEMEKYSADWERYGRGAGPRRNRQMAKVSDLLICFWNEKSRGTKSMIELAAKCETLVKMKIIPTVS